jgi:hypothetical protein
VHLKHGYCMLIHFIHGYYCIYRPWQPLTYQYFPYHCISLIYFSFTMIRMFLYAQIKSIWLLSNENIIITDPSKCINDQTLRSDREFCRTSHRQMSDQIDLKHGYCMLIHFIHGYYCIYRPWQPLTYQYFPYCISLIYFSFTKIRMFLYAQFYWLAEFGNVSCLQFNYLRVETLTPTWEDLVGHLSDNLVGHLSKAEVNEWYTVRKVLIC